MKYSVDYFLKSDSFINYILGVEAVWNVTDSFVEENRAAIDEAAALLCSPFDVSSELSSDESALLKRGILTSIASL